MQQTYNDAVNLLTSAGKFRISLGLERMERILELLGNPQDKLDCIHVAGTNGKGSVCAILASILSESGKFVGLYTSPHLFKYTERIKISGILPVFSDEGKFSCHSELDSESKKINANVLKKDSTPTLTLPHGEGIFYDISDEDFAKYVFEILDLADQNGIDLTEFEILTAVMFKYFTDIGVDVVVLETGLGGRFDATNVIKRNLCSVITHIDFDHTERLGDTLEKISYEKTGIIKQNCPCISFESFIPAVKPNVDVAEFIENLALKGAYQRENLALALGAIRTVFPQISTETIKNGLQKVNHPCRFQYIKEKNLIIDGAHNPNGISELKKSLDEYSPNTPRRFIFGCLRNKDYNKMVNLLFESHDEVYFYHFNHQNSCEYSDLQKVCSTQAQELLPETKIDFNDGHLNIFCGSLYMMAELAQRFDILRNI